MKQCSDIADMCSSFSLLRIEAQSAHIQALEAELAAQKERAVGEGGHRYQRDKPQHREAVHASVSRVQPLELAGSQALCCRFLRGATRSGGGRGRQESAWQEPVWQEPKVRDRVPSCSRRFQV